MVMEFDFKLKPDLRSARNVLNFCVSYKEYYKYINLSTFLHFLCAPMPANAHHFALNGRIKLISQFTQKVLLFLVL